MCIALGLERLLENKIPICMICNHDILVARASPDRESTCVIRVKFAKRHHIEKELVSGKCRC